jgi:hypothetical protein
MEERFVPGAPAEARPIDTRGGDSRAGSTPDAIDDPRALQILTTEHWSLLTARSLVYNETFARGGMFLAFLSATLLVLGLISTATGFSDAFLSVAAIVLALDLFIGLASLGRISAASNEDIRYLQGMNRLRHAYHEMVPELERYFITSHHDDMDSVLAIYGPAEFSQVRSIAHGFTTMPGMVAVICSAVAGGLVAVLVLLATHDPFLAGAAGLVGFIGCFVVGVAMAIRAVDRFVSSVESRFPAPGAKQPRL